MRQITDYQLVSTINTSLDNIFLYEIINYWDNRPHMNNIIHSYMDFEYNEQTN